MVGAVFIQGRCWSGPPQIHEGFIDLYLPNSRFGHRLCLSALDGDDLSLKLVVELPQFLLFTNSALAIESLLLLIAI